ncbi:VrrA/YqfQ family protein [Rossellomorea marisflavi]|uniref:VrrA/YqfQ family protein n=1 Tax=Rossellomorea marisflavi TaxID=189381 RepID=UPI003AEA7BBE
MPPRGMMRMRGGNPFGMQQRNPFGMQQSNFRMQQGNPFMMQQNRRNQPTMGRTSPSPFQMSGGQPGKKKGLLSKLFKKGENRGGGTPEGGAGLLEQFTRSVSDSGMDRSPQAAGGILQGLMNPGNIGSFLTNTQQVLQTAQQLGPMVSQYGPMVKNIPALWKLYRGLKDVTGDEETNADAEEASPQPKDQDSEETVETPALDEESEPAPPVRPKAPRKTGQSSPKLYI